jgi:NADH-quinone oxidoreductase subunit K
VALRATPREVGATNKNLKTMIIVQEYISLGLILFVLGILGIIVNRKNIIILLMSIELTLLSVNFILISASTLLDDATGQLFALYILVVAAAESAIGLAILVAYYRVRGTIAVRFINLLRG